MEYRRDRTLLPLTQATPAPEPLCHPPPARKHLSEALAQTWSPVLAGSDAVGLVSAVAGRSHAAADLLAD